MPRPRASVPKYSLDKQSGQACVYIDRRRIYLGRYGSAESRRRYRELVHRHTAETPRPATSGNSALSINELCWEFKHSKFPTFKTSGKRESSECTCYRLVIRILRELFGETAADTFGPRKLRLVRDAMIAKGWSRQFINKQIGRLRCIFRFGVSWEMVSQTVADALKSVPPLLAGQTETPETKPRKPIAQADIDAAKEHLRQRNRDIVDLLLLTGARPAELLSLRTCDIDQSGDVWKAKLGHHKTAHRGKERTLYFGPQCQLILRRNFQTDLQARLFPTSVDSLSKAIRGACVRAGVPEFTAYYCRHTAC